MVKIHVFLAAVAMILGVASAITDEERNALKEVVTPLIANCRDKFAITLDEVLTAKKDENIDALDPCFYDCFFKKVGFITEDGLYDPDVTLAKNKKYIKGEDDVKLLTDISKACTSVNEETLADDTCERSKLLLSCFIKEKANSLRFSPFASD